MTQTIPATAILGPGKTGLTIGYRILSLDGTTYSAFSTTGVTETSTAGTYSVAGGVVAPTAGGYIVWGTALVDYAEDEIGPEFSYPGSVTGAGAYYEDLLAWISAVAQTVNSSSDSTAAGAITRRRGDTWSIPFTLGAITGWTSLWITVKSDHEDADTAALVQVKLNATGLLDGLMYVNGAAASSDALAGITVGDEDTGAIIVAVDETITAQLTPGEYVYDAQVLIGGNTSTPDSGTFTVTADVTRSVT
jgi:hypothetical protein